MTRSFTRLDTKAQNALGRRIEGYRLKASGLYMAHSGPYGKVAFWSSNRGLVSMRALSKAVGVSVAAIAHYEAGRRAPTIAVLERIARALGTSPNDLLGWKPTAVASSHDRAVRIACNLLTMRAPR